MPDFTMGSPKLQRISRRKLVSLDAFDRRIRSPNAKKCKFLAKMDKATTSVVGNSLR
jgi:hypothetical protein